jgi:hypothetical protein
MAGRRTQTRTLRATKNQVANQLQSIQPGITGSDIIAVQRSPDATFWQATITTGFVPFNPIEDKKDTFVEFDAPFLITNLISAIDPTVTAAMIEDVLISPTDATKIEVILKRVKI